MNPEPTLPELIRLDAALSIAPAAASGGDEPRRFTMSAYDGGLLRLPNYPVPVVIDLAGMEAAPQVKALLHHDTSRPVGHMTAVNITDRIEAQGVLSVPGHAAEILAAQRHGFQWEASVGATPNPGTLETIDRGQTVRVNGRTFVGPLVVARRTKLREISFVGAGAGENTSAALAASRAVPFETDPAMPDPVIKTDSTDSAASQTTQAAPDQKPEHKPASNPPADTINASLNGGATQTPANSPAPTAAPPTSEAPISVEVREIQASLRNELAEIRKEREALQRERLVESVDRIAAQYQCTDAEILASLRQKAAGGGCAETDIELEILRASRGRGLAGFQPAGKAKDGPAHAHVIEASLCVTQGWEEQELAKHFDEKTVNEAISARYSGMGVRGLVLEYLGSRGHHVVGGQLTESDLQAALGFAEAETIQASGGFSTMSLPGILSNIAHKEMLRGYDAVEAAISVIARRASAKNYKPFFAYRLSTSGLLEQVGKDGELKSMTLVEDEFQTRVYPWGRKLALTYVDVKDDDLSSFSDLARLFGIMAKRTVEKTGATVLHSDLANFFTTGKGNRIADSADAALDLDSLGSAYALFLQMKDSTGEPISLAPKYLLTSPSDAVLARNINQGTTVNLALAGTTDMVSERVARNPFQGMFIPKWSPYLATAAVTGALSTAWFLCGDPAIASPVTLAYLDGRSTPRVRPWSAIPGKLGMQWDIDLSFGWSLHDDRGAVYSKGAA